MTLDESSGAPLIGGFSRAPLGFVGVDYEYGESEMATQKAGGFPAEEWGLFYSLKLNL